MFRKFTLLLLFPLFFCSCSKKETDFSKKPSILVSIAPYAFFAEKIAGDTLEIQTLIPPGTNLHIYEPSPKSVEQSAKAIVFFRIDEPVEQKVVASLKERNPKMQMVNLQENLPILKGDEAIELTPCTGHHHDRDLHTWLSPKLALEQAKMISETLIQLFPENKVLYERNFNNLALEMVTLQKDIEAELLPFAGEAILVSHPAFSYFCKDFGLVQLSVECEGKDPRPRDVENILKKADTYKIRCVLLQQGFNNRGAVLIGKKLQLPNYRVEPYARDYLTNMRKISGSIAK